MMHLWTSAGGCHFAPPERAGESSAGESPSADVSQASWSQPETPQSEASQSSTSQGKEDRRATSIDERAEMTPDELAEAQEYGRLDLNAAVLDRAIDLGYLAIMALLVAQPLDDWLWHHRLLMLHDTLRLAALFAIVLGLHLVVSFPVSCYSGYVLEHRFGLSRQSFGRWLWRYAQRNVLGAAFGLATFTALFWLIWTVGAAWWLVAGGVFLVVGVVLGQLFPVLILPLFYKVEPLDDPALAERLAQRAEGTGLKLQGVYRMELSRETVKANAMLTGLGRTRRVLLGDTLLDHFTHDEIDVIFAHELGHHVHRHIPKMIAAGAVYSLAGFYLADRVLVGLFPGQFDYQNLPVWTLPLLMLLITLFSMVLEPLQNAISRRYERQCDRYALEKTGLRAAYRSAFKKLARINKDTPDVPWLEVVLFHSHPPISERLAMADK